MNGAVPLKNLIQPSNPIHSADRFASIFVMVRVVVARPDQISVATHDPDGLLQIRLTLYRPHEVAAIYQ